MGLSNPIVKVTHDYHKFPQSKTIHMRTVVKCYPNQLMIYAFDAHVIFTILLVCYIFRLRSN